MKSRFASTFLSPSTRRAPTCFFPAVFDYVIEADTLMGNTAVFALPATIRPSNGYFDGINYRASSDHLLRARPRGRAEADA